LVHSPAPLGEGNERRSGEGSTEIPLRQPANRNDRGSAIGKVIAKCHSDPPVGGGRSLFFPPPFGGERSFEIPLRQLTDRNDKGSAIGKAVVRIFYEKLGNVSVSVAWSDTDALLCRGKLGVNRVEITHPLAPLVEGS